MTITLDVAAHNQTIDELCERIQKLQARWPLSTGRRILIAFAGVPGSGKSTISSALMAAMKQHGEDRVAVVPMDGYHLPKAALAKLENVEEAFRRRGAPFTFDVNAFVKTVASLNTTPVTVKDDPSLAIYLPSFDHAEQDPVSNNIRISSATQVLIIEGNYLLLDEAPWNTISTLVDEAWFVNVSSDVAKQRLVKRHLQAGIESTAEAAATRAEGNDLPNGELIRAKLIKPDVIILN